MKIAPLAEVKDKFSAYVDSCQESPVIITKHGKPVAYLAPIRDEAELDSMLLAHHPRFRRLLEAAEARHQQGESLSSDEFWAELDRRSTEQNAE